MDVTAILLCAGFSARFGSNKIIEKIHDKHVFLYSLETLQSNKNINKVLLMVNERDFDYISKIVNNEKIEILIGGNTRKETVLKALAKTKSKFVLIQDGARPNLKDEYINECLKHIKKYDGVIMGSPSVDTVKIVDGDNLVLETTKRSTTYLIETPQVFRTKELLESYNKYDYDYLTDDSSYMELDNKKILVIKSDGKNLKLTKKEDLDIMKLFLKDDKNV